MVISDPKYGLWAGLDVDDECAHQRLNVTSLISVVFGALSIIMLGFIFGPLGGIFGLLAIFRGQIGLGLLGMFLSGVGFVTSLLGIALFVILFGFSLF